MGMTTSEMRADVKELLKRVDEDAKGTRCLTMAEVTLCLDELRRLATPSVASPRAAWKDDALQSRINEAVDEANGVTAAPVGEPGRTPQGEMSQQEEISWSAFCAEEAAKCFDALQADGMLTDREYFTGYIGGIIEDGFNIWKAKRAAPIEVLSAEGGAILKDLHIPSPSQQVSGEHRADSKQTSAAPPAQGAPTPTSSEIGGGSLKAQAVVPCVPEASRESDTGGESYPGQKFFHEHNERIKRAELAAQGAPGTREAQITAEQIIKFDRKTGSTHMSDREQWGELMVEQINAALAQPGAPTKEG